MRHLLARGACRRGCAARRLRLGQRAAIGPRGEVEQGVELLRLGVDQPLAEGRGPVVDRLAQGLEHLGVAVLRGIFQHLGEGVDERQRVLADVMQLVPEPVEPRLLRLVEHQPDEVVVLAVEQGERDDFVHRHDLGVAERRGEQLAEVVEGRLEPLPAALAFVDDDRRGDVAVAESRAVGGDVTCWGSPASRRLPATTCSCTLPSAPVSLSSAPVATNSRPATSSAGRRNLDDRRGLDAQARRRRWRCPSGCLPNSAGSRPHWPASRRSAAGTRLAASVDRLAVAEHRAEQRPAERRELAIEPASGLSFAAGGPEVSSVLDLVGQLALLVGALGRLPFASSEPAGITGPARRLLVRLGVEVPDARIAEPVGVGVAGQHVARDVGGQVPGPAAVAGSVSFRSTAVRSQAWLPSRGPISSETRSPACTRASRSARP